MTQLIIHNPYSLLFFHQNSDSSCESHHAVLSSKSTVSFTALRRTSLNSSNISLNQQPDPHLAHAAAQIFATDTEGMIKFIIYFPWKLCLSAPGVSLLLSSPISSVTTSVSLCIHLDNRNNNAVCILQF